MKIDAPKTKDEYASKLYFGEDCIVRLVRESDWRRIMAVVKAVDADLSSPHQLTSLSDKTWVAWKDLQSHVAKRKSK